MDGDGDRLSGWLATSGLSVEGKEEGDGDVSE